MKTCRRCKKEKPQTEFYQDSRMTDGRFSLCKVCWRRDSSNYYANNKEKVKAYQAIPKVKVRKAKLKKQWNIDNKEHVKNYFKKFATKRSQLRMERYRNDKEYRILVLLRGRMYRALAGICRSKKTMELIGCSIDEFIKHTESLFTEGMTWDNQGKWEIDHIKPCSSFDLTDSAQQEECFNYANLQPLWAEDNRKKRNQELF